MEGFIEPDEKLLEEKPEEIVEEPYVAPEPLKPTAAPQPAVQSSVSARLDTLERENADLKKALEGFTGKTVATLVTEAEAK